MKLARKLAARRGLKVNAISKWTGRPCESPLPWCTPESTSFSTRTKPAQHLVPSPRRPATDRLWRPNGIACTTRCGKSTGGSTCLSGRPRRMRKAPCTTTGNVRGPGGIIKAKNKPGPNPGFTPAPLAKSIEEQPSWAWDVAGTYRVRSTQLAWAFGIETEWLNPVGTEMTMMNKSRERTITVYVDNMPHHHRKSGRQIWGEIEFLGIHGVFKLCPGSLCDAVNDGQASFDDACVLKDGVWPGPRPMGERSWGLKWHGFDEHGATEDSDGWFRDHKCVTEIIFEKTADGKMAINGIMMVEDKPVMLTATKVWEGRKRGVRDGKSATEAWGMYRPRYSLVDRWS